ncbi:unnamed protein product [Prorocentrum cordatum]|uniref:Reverse transcriptase domain-containing protein n=1 Tax=Prorocentrum cordatum TaxID=2364126 RepID=A0ABN9QXQ6_9DINO|nr:unnamed protein product [Polarella glacialis]
MSVGGRHYPGFNMSSGIRQFCPLSPLVFATAMDLLLRVLAQRLGPDVAIRAFADDVGIVLTGVEKQLPVLEQALREFGDLSGMSVNLPKTVGIPLREDSLESAAVAVAGACPAWGQLPLKRAAIYLGCAVGPSKEDLLWSSAVRKFRERVGGWPWNTMGLHFATAAYNTHALPVLSFIAQVANPSEEALDAEAWALRRAAPGPGNWATQEDLWGLKEHYGMPRSFGSVAAMARACQMRVLCLENSAHGGLQIDGMGLQLQDALGQTDFPQRRGLWDKWFVAAIPSALIRNEHALRQRGITRDSIAAEALGGGKSFQAAARELIGRSYRSPAHFQIRHKLDRWLLPGTPRNAATRFEQRMGLLRGLVPPRVVAAVFSAAWNRWCTERRFQRRANATKLCRFGCGGAAEDSIEHYDRCCTVRHFHRTSLRLEAEWLLPHWLGARDFQLQENTLVLGALGAYAVYRASNVARAHSGMPAEAALRVLQQALREAAAGHRSAERTLAELWA